MNRPEHLLNIPARSESYSRHWCGGLVWRTHGRGRIACMIHGCSVSFVRTASRAITELNERMIANRAAPPQSLTSTTRLRPSRGRLCGRCPHAGVRCGKPRRCYRRHRAGAPRRAIVSVAHGAGGLPRFPLSPVMCAVCSHAVAEHARVPAWANQGLRWAMHQLLRHRIASWACG